MMLRMLRQPRLGRPSMLARGIALLVVLGMVAITAPTLSGPMLGLLRWVGGLL